MKLDLVQDEVDRPWRPAAEICQLAENLVDRAGPSDGELQVVLTDDATLQDLNRQYRDKDQPTDVLSFSYLNGHGPARADLLGGASAREYADAQLPGDDAILVGQVLISLETVRARPPREGRNLDEEVLFLVAHGLLHVLGFDHEDDAHAEEMAERERELVAPILDEYRALLGGEGP